MIQENIFSEGIRLQGNEKMELFNNLTYFHDKSCQMYIDPNVLCLFSVYQSNKDELLQLPSSWTAGTVPIFQTIII